MRIPEVEHWALRLIDQVASGGPSEDSLAELKAEWPEPERAA